MSILNLKIIFVKKQTQTPERPTQGRGGKDIHHNRNGRFHTRDENSCVRWVIHLIICVR